MGAEPWLYFVPYCKDLETALHELREKEFLAGRYRGREYVSKSGWSYSDWSGNLQEEIQQLILQHGGVESAIEAVFAETEPNGTGTILDMFEISDAPDYCAVTPLSDQTLIELFETDKPTHDMIESSNIWDYIERGQGISIIIYRDGEMSEICFAGYSFD